MSIFGALCVAQLAAAAVAQLANVEQLVALAAPEHAPPALLEEGVCAGAQCMEPIQTQVDRLLALTKTNPALSCAGAFMLISTHREPGLTGSFGMPLTRMGILNAGIGELAAQGLLRSLEAESAPHSLVPPGQLCWMTLSTLGVQYDHERSLAAYEHAPSLWEAVVAWNKRVRRIPFQLRISVMEIAGIFGTPPSDQCLRDLDKAGGFDFIFEVLEQNSSNLDLMQAAWAGLSDNVENRRVGAELVANKGGTGKGLEFLISLLPAYRGKHAWPTMQFGLRYESIHDICGILMHDDEERTWQKIAAKAGFMEEAICAMREEPEDHLTQENGCEAVALMGRGSAENLARLEELGAVELTAAAISTFKTKPNTDGYYHLNSCSSALVLFAKEGAHYQDRMLQLGLLNSMEASIAMWRDEQKRRDPWGSLFPWSDVEELQQILTKRHKEAA